MNTSMRQERTQSRILIPHDPKDEGVTEVDLINLPPRGRSQPHTASCQPLQKQNSLQQTAFHKSAGATGSIECSTQSLLGHL